jgi:hypothetical protein
MSTEESQRDSRYPLAFDSNGNPIQLPEAARAWRVRRGGGRRGRPRNVFDETGRQLEIPLGAGIDDLIDAGCPSGRYLLYPIDGEGKVIPGIVAVTETPETALEPEDDGAPAVPQSDPLLREMLLTLKASNESLCRALEATTSGYGPVRPQPLPQPVYVEQPAPPKDEGGFKPEQMAQVAGMAKMVFDAIKGMGIVGMPTAPTEGAS